jgi:Winged helix DNA-binding domain
VIPPAEGSRLDRRTLNRTLLARQHLLARVDRPVHDAIEGLVGLQAQVPRDPYIALWSRLRGFDPVDIETLILERQAVRMTLMRTTLHLVTSDDAWILREVMQDVCERGYQSSPFRRQLEGIGLEELLAAGAAIVAERPRTVSELGRILSERWPAYDRMALAYAVRYLVPVVQVPPRGLWRRSAAPRVTTLATWLGLRAEGAPSADLMVDEIVLRYLRAFGPATISDIRTWSWLSGLRSVIDRLRPRLRIYHDEARRELLDVEDGVFADAGEPAPVRFLGEYDNVFLSHADRSRITGDTAWGVAYARRGTFFVDGFLAGAWSASAIDGRASITIEPRRPIAAAIEEVAAEGEALLRLLEPDSVPSVEFVTG